MCFWVKKFFLKKNWIVLETSITILLMCTTDVYPFSPNLAPVFSLHLLILICVHLFLPVRISSYLSEFIFICQNLLLCLKSFLVCETSENLFFSLRISENLFLSARISFLWEPLRENLFRENLFSTVFVKISKGMNTITQNKSFIIKTWSLYFVEFICSSVIFFTLNSF